ncbi:MAG: 50S ribosomal protein L4 [Patescibacteria group bacterium]|nr:50S ribosomal protein L4 [Patescibacteria group bacterium]
MEIQVYNEKGEEQGKTELGSDIFDVKMNFDLVHQTVVTQTANKRQISANTKDRGDVRGGGKKPWRQKGTGRARHGSRRSPIWKGGGATFGPTNERNFKKDISKKMKRKALFTVLSQKLKDNEIFILDKLKIEKPKTKIMLDIIQNLKKEKKASALIALPNLDRNLILSARNAPKTATIQAKDLNALDLLKYKYLIMPKQSIKVIQETFTDIKKASRE